MRNLSTLTSGAQGVLAFFLPRYNFVPGGPVRLALRCVKLEERL